MKRTLQNRHGSVLMEFILVIPIFIVLIAWTVGNAQYARAVIRLESYQRALFDAHVMRGNAEIAGEKRLRSMYAFFTSGNAGSGVFKENQVNNWHMIDALRTSGAVGDRAGVVMHGTRLRTRVDGLDLVQEWLNAASILLGGNPTTGLLEEISTTQDFTDGRYGLYGLARAEHWRGYLSARHAETKYLAGNSRNWDFQTAETYPAGWTHAFLTTHKNNGDVGPKNLGVRKLYARHPAWEAWSK